jgi:predicted amidophosphoribosyltransferase
MTKSRQSKFTFKVCANCGAQAHLGRRVCQTCGKGQGRSIFRAPTQTEADEHTARQQSVREYLKHLDDEMDRSAA